MFSYDIEITVPTRNDEPKTIKDTIEASTPRVAINAIMRLHFGRQARILKPGQAIIVVVRRET